MRLRLQPLIHLDGHTVLVTGAGRGLGRAYAHLLASRGAHVVVHDAGVELDGSGGDTSVADAVVAEVGGSATAAYENLDSREACRALVERAGPLDAVVLNAGIVAFRSLEETDEATWDAIRRVQAEAPLWIAQAAFPLMRERGYGRFVVTVSGHGLYRAGSADLVAYSMAKAAAFGLMNVLADAGEEHGILANAISPVAATRMYRGTAGRDDLAPELVAPAVVFLASPACTFSGLVVRAAGGRFSIGRYTVGDEVDFGSAPALPEQVAEALAPLAPGRDLSHG